MLRNAQAMCLLDMCYQGFITQPFLTRPAFGPLQQVIRSEQRSYYSRIGLSDLLRKKTKDPLVKEQTKSSVIDLAVTRSIAKTQGASSMYQDRINDRLQYYKVSDRGLARTNDPNGLDNAI